MARPPLRQKRNSILILCEGSKTEPNYLGALVRDLGLTAVSVPRNHETDPFKLVQEGIKKLKADPNLSCAYIVFDRDSHNSHSAALSLARQHPLFGSRLKIICSYPCVEIWLLYHFSYTRAPLTSEEAVNRLKGELTGYEKGSVSCMDDFIPKIPKAIYNADRSLEDASVTGEMNPSTDFHLLVQELQILAH